jgi:hypothetical protein
VRTGLLAEALEEVLAGVLAAPGTVAEAAVALESARRAPCSGRIAMPGGSFGPRCKTRSSVCARSSVTLVVANDAAGRADHHAHNAALSAARLATAASRAIAQRLRWRGMAAGGGALDTGNASAGLWRAEAILDSARAPVAFAVRVQS